MSDIRIDDLGDGRFSLHGNLTFRTASKALELSRRLFSDHASIEVDLADVDRGDSAGLALLLEWQSICKKAGKPLAMNGAPDSLLELARLCGAEKRLQLNGREAA